jgi:hypothetical protein
MSLYVGKKESTSHCNAMPCHAMLCILFPLKKDIAIILLHHRVIYQYSITLFLSCSCPSPVVLVPC